jgi:hypothetical protein
MRDAGKAIVISPPRIPHPHSRILPNKLLVAGSARATRPASSYFFRAQPVRRSPAQYAGREGIQRVAATYGWVVLYRFRLQLCVIARWRYFWNTSARRQLTGCAIEFVIGPDAEVRQPFFFGVPRGNGALQIVSLTPGRKPTRRHLYLALRLRRCGGKQRTECSFPMLPQRPRAGLDAFLIWAG